MRRFVVGLGVGVVGPGAHDRVGGLERRRPIELFVGGGGAGGQSLEKDVAQQDRRFVGGAGIAADDVEPDLQHRLYDPLGEDGQVDVGAQVSAPARARRVSSIDCSSAVGRRAANVVSS